MDATQAVPLLVASQLTKSFGGTPVLRAVDLEIGRGECVALIGPSGSGKSTLLHCLGGLERPDGGSLTFDGQPFAELTDEALADLRRRRLSSIFQFFHLLPTLTAEENIAFPLRLLGLDRQIRESRVNELLEQTKLTSRRAAFPHELSGGEQQRVAIARALIIHPAMILADEPTGNLDSTTGNVILDLIESLTETYETALLLVTHSREATRVCHRTLRMRDGQLDHAD